jgi:hypothetical protein
VPRLTYIRAVLLIGLVAALAYVAWVFANRKLSDRKAESELSRKQQRSSAELDKIYGGSEVKILQFYSPTSGIAPGQSATICYGVLNAKKVSIEPPVDGVSPALNRCVEVQPRHETKYTLTAEGDDGRVVSASLVLKLRTAAPSSAVPAPDGPRILAFNIAKSTVEQGKHVFLLHFQVEDAAEVSIDPKAFPTTRAASGDFYVMPEQTTSYTLTAVGKNGRKVVRQLTVEVPNR